MTCVAGQGAFPAPEQGAGEARYASNRAGRTLPSGEERGLRAGGKGRGREGRPTTITDSLFLSILFRPTQVSQEAYSIQNLHISFSAEEFNSVW